MSDARIAVDRLLRFVAAAAVAQGVRADHALIFAQRMVEADLRGMHGHGVVRLAPYGERLQAGGYNLDPDIRAVRESPSSALVDGDNGLGQVVVTYAVELAIAKAQETGLAWVGIRGSNHAGAGGVYTALALPHDMVSMYMAVANANHMPPWGGVDMLLSTNPMAFAIPAGEEPPFVLDMATTVASFGKIRAHVASGEPMPVGWMIDRRGEPITDPSRAHEGFLLPIGGYKGYGLNLVVGLLAGVLNGAALGSAIVNFSEDFKTATNTGQLFFAMRPDLFRDLDGFKAEMDVRLREIRNSTPMEGQGPIRIPGDQTPAREAEMRAQGVPVTEAVLRSLRGVAESLGLEDRLEL